MSLCQPMLNEFKKAMSMDIAEPYLGQCKPYKYISI